MKKNNNKQKASILIFTLFLTMIALIAGMSIITISGLEISNSGFSGRSVQAFQVADNGLEFAMTKIGSSNASSAISSIAPFNCSGSEITRSAFAGNGIYVLTFFDDNGQQLSCTDLIGSIETIKSVGTYYKVSRAIEVNLP